MLPFADLMYEICAWVNCSCFFWNASSILPFVRAHNLYADMLIIINSHDVLIVDIYDVKEKQN